MHHTLALENGKMEGGVEKFVGDACQSWPVHQQDRAALVVKLPLAFHEKTFVPVSRMRLVAR